MMSTRPLISGFIFALSLGLIALALPKVGQAQASNAQVCAEQYNGISFTAPAGSPVRVADEGVVASISQQTSFGRYAQCDRYVVVFHQHSNGKRVYTRYGGLGELAALNGVVLKVGSRVKKNESLGHLGHGGELVFEVRPLDDVEGQPNWSSIFPTDPNKFDFVTYHNSDATPRAATTWTRYQKQDIDAYLKNALTLFQPGQEGVKVFPQPVALRMKASLVESPFPCSSDGLKRMGAMVGLNIPTNINHCVRVGTPKGKVLRVYVQDAVASFLAREIGVGDNVELFVTHVFTNLSQGENAEAVFGISVNEFNVIP